MQAFVIVGAVGSPYSRKLRAVFRYRQIPYRWVNSGSPESRSLPRPKISLMPQLILDGEAQTDTTPLIRELERRVTNERSVIPSDPAIAFLDALIEDYGYEWLTKMMFHYRWAFEADIQKAQTILPRWFGMTQSDEQLAQAGKVLAERQIERLRVVGSNQTTAPVIEDSYARFLDLLEDHLRAHRFVMGDRPGTSDFALFGQLTQLALFDPTSAATALERAPRVCAYTEIVEDLSGLEADDSQWVTRETLPPTLRALLIEIGRVYAPFLLANAAALTLGSERVECQIDGRPWTQKPFPYQGKCLKWLRDDYAQLNPNDKAFVDQTLSGTGCAAFFAT